MYHTLSKPLWFVIHSLLGAIGAPIAAAVLAYSVILPLHKFIPSVGERTAHWILTETPYFPLQIFVGFLWGFLISRRLKQLTMLWAWSLPALAILLAVRFDPLRPVVSGIEITGFSRFFGWSCLPQNHCFEQVALTIPLYAATAYSLGALLARRIAAFNAPSHGDSLFQSGQR
jgi:hypothetical protein